MSTTKQQKTGEIGEKIACEYLVKNSFQILERNYKKPWGELDIVAEAPDNTIVFVEVKTMAKIVKKGSIKGKTPSLLRGWGGLDPEHQMTESKIKKLKKTAILYAGYNESLINDEAGWRIDVITVVLGKNFLKNREDYQLRHYENIF